MRARTIDLCTLSVVTVTPVRWETAINYSVAPVRSSAKYRFAAIEPFASRSSVKYQHSRGRTNSASPILYLNQRPITPLPNAEFRQLYIADFFIYHVRTSNGLLITSNSFNLQLLFTNILSLKGNYFHLPSLLSVYFRVRNLKANMAIVFEIWESLRNRFLFHVTADCDSLETTRMGRFFVKRKESQLITHVKNAYHSWRYDPKHWYGRNRFPTIFLLIIL